MSNHTLTIPGPSGLLTALRALAARAAGHTMTLLHRLGHGLTARGPILATAATSTLALLGTATGFTLARRTLGTVLHGTGTALRTTMRLAVRAAAGIGRAALRPFRFLDPALAATCQHAAATWITQPSRRIIDTTWRRLTRAGASLAHLSDTRLVRTATVTAAQATGLILGLHALTDGALAATLVTALPATMTAVVWATQPATALILVTATFLTALAVAAARSWTARPSHHPDPDPTDPAAAATGDGTPRLIAEPRPRDRAPINLDAVAAALHIEVTGEGSVVVHGIPDDLPEHVALQVAHTAADAATRRLGRILLHRTQPNRDDRRLLTKTAREAVRRHARTVA
jgi:hypothetical protein